ncbi:hypothetical protein KIN20_002286 [Parelaphostrongylus tenuis]|uniref:Uncharacterized protein n=1 Tax=Parelaphostrongylus tenuis TaxID=148309 RepID=A0AAD5LVE9_PARTN|nr:hypothetical protein KIN20_002286 [Parelaphostrongylus tenuis]
MDRRQDAKLNASAILREGRDPSYAGIHDRLDYYKKRENYLITEMPETNLPITDKCQRWPVVMRDRTNALILVDDVKLLRYPLLSANQSLNKLASSCLLGQILQTCDLTVTKCNGV